RLISPSSRSRPTKLVSWRGRVVVRPCPVPAAVAIAARTAAAAPPLGPASPAALASPGSAIARSVTVAHCAITCPCRPYAPGSIDGHRPTGSPFPHQAPKRPARDRPRGARFARSYLAEEHGSRTGRRGSVGALTGYVAQVPL